MILFRSHLILLIRIIALIYLINNIRFTITHVKGSANLHADHLSHLKLDHFMQQMPEVTELQYLSPWDQVCPLYKDMLKNYYKQLTERTLIAFTTEHGTSS